MKISSGLIFLFIGVFLVPSVYSTVGDQVVNRKQFPLIFGTTGSLNDLLHRDGFIWRTCQAEKTIKLEVERDFLSVDCSVYADEFIELRSKCYQDAVIKIATLCQLKDEDMEFVNKAVENNQFIMDALLKMGVEKAVNFTKMASSCLFLTIYDNVKSCAQGNTYENIRYDERGCRAMESYINCTNSAFKLCSDDMADKQTEIMNAAMQVSCKDDNKSLAQLKEETNNILSNILQTLKENTKLLRELKSKKQSEDVSGL